MKKLLSQFIQFCGVGGIMLVLSLATYYVAFELFNLPLYTTYFLCYLCFIWLSYQLNARFTFKSKRNFSDMSKYYLVYIGGLGMGLLILWFLEYNFTFSKFHMILLQIIPRTIFTFGLSKILIFK